MGVEGLHLNEEHRRIKKKTLSKTHPCWEPIGHRKQLPTSRGGARGHWISIRPEHPETVNPRERVHMQSEPYREVPYEAGGIPQLGCI